MRVTIEISNPLEMEHLLAYFRSMEVGTIEVVSSDSTTIPKIQHGDKALDPQELFGIWENNPRTIDDVRTIAWKRK
jgi:hypothetical protein